ncbi:MAG TPA: hypothetical protein VMT95_04415 [Candidatus Binatia bacterium]|nr:hypothetical protein [Candidatus Binatia bacterium]
MILALQKPSAPAPNPTPPPALKTIIRMKTSPFCEAFRENVFHAVEGLRVNDRVIEQGRSLLAKTAYDGVVDRTGMPGPVPGVPPQNLGAPSVRMDQYQLGQVMGQIAHNLQRVYGLLNDPRRFAEHPQNDADRELATMKSALLAIAEAQERSLNLISGEYETAALDDMFARGDNTAGALGAGSIVDKNLKLGDPILASPGSSPLPAGGALPHGSLFAGTPVGGVAALVDISQRLTGDTEDQVLSAVLPGMDRCR